jgi:hypothetical protein
MSDLERIAPTPRKITVAGETIEVSPLRVRDLPAMARALAPIATAIPAIAGAANPTAALAQAASEDVGRWIEAIISGVAVATGRPEEWVGELEIDEIITLAGAVVEANVDFFVRSILPRIQDAARRVTAAIDGGTAG